MKNIILLAILSAFCASLSFGQTKTRQVGDDGFVWFKLDDGKGHYGVEDVHGKILIPLSRMYCDIKYEYYNSSVRFFGVKKNCGTGFLDGQAGVCDIFGKEIISPKYDIEKYICIVYATPSESVNGNTGFHVVDYKDNNYPTSFMHIYLDQDSKAYRISSGTRIYISDGTNSISNISANLVKSGNVESVWYDHDVYLNGQKGMKIHSKMNINGYKGQSFKMRVCHFFYHEDGRKLWGNTSGYTTNDRDQVAAWAEDRVTPTWDETTYNDWWVFIPYTALHCNSSCTLKIASVLRDESSGNWLGDNAYVTFINYNTGNAPVYNQPVAQSPFYYPIPQFNFSPKFDFSNVNTNVPIQTGGGGYFGGGYDSGSNNTGGSGNVHHQYTKTCGVCHGTGKCNNCVNGWVTRMGMGKDGPCPVCPNHNGLCSSCGGRGTWKE